MKIQLLLNTLILLSAQIYSQPNTWHQKSNFPSSNRAWSVGFSIGNKGYVGVGRDSSVQYSDFWEYNPSSDSWTQKANFPIVEYGLMSFSIGTKGYVYDGAATLNFFEYDPILNLWNFKSDFTGSRRFKGVGFSIGNKGYIGTGTYAGNYYSDFWEYDPFVNSWTQKANFGGVGRFEAIGFGIGNKGYITTGNDGVNPYNDIWEFDPVGNSWTPKANLPAPTRWGASGFSIGNKGFVATGSSVLVDLWEFDPVLNSWSQKTNFPGVPRYGASSFTIDNKAYVCLGQDTTIYYNDLWEYTADTTVNINEEGGNYFIVSLFPNPFSNFANIKFERTLHHATLKIVDSSGKKILDIENIDGDHIQLKGSTLSDGIYYYQLIENKKILAHGKFEVQ